MYTSGNHALPTSVSTPERTEYIVYTAAPGMGSATDSSSGLPPRRLPEVNTEPTESSLAQPRTNLVNGHMAQNGFDNPMDLSNGKMVQVGGMKKEDSRQYDQQATNYHHNGVSSVPVGISDTHGKSRDVQMML